MTGVGHRDFSESRMSGVLSSRLAITTGLLEPVGTGEGPAKDRRRGDGVPPS